MKQAISDEELTGLFLSRDERALEAVGEKYGKKLHSAAFNVLRDNEECEECVNDSLLSAWDHIPTDRPQNLLAYLTRIVRNAALDRVKEKHRKKRIPPERLSSLDDLSEVLESDSTVEKEIDGQLLSAFLSRFAHSLPEKQRVIFVMRYYYYDSVKAISASVGLSQTAVYQNLAEIRDKLRDGLKTEGFV